MRHRGPAWLLVLGGLASLAGCRSRDAVPPVASSLIDLGEEARRVLGLALPPRALTEARFAELLARVRAGLGASRGTRGADRLARLLFGELGFRREVRDRSLAPGLLHWVLEHRRGGCLGLGTLLLALGEPLGVPLEGVLVPGHFFVRYRAADGRRAIELLRQGGEMPEGWYRERYPMPAEHPLYLRGLRPEETLAALRFNLANALRERGDLQRAVDEYRRVVGRLPDFAEAHANLGLAYQQLGDEKRAEESYRRAGRAHPGLPGLEHNLRALRGASSRARPASPPRK